MSVLRIQPGVDALFEACTRRVWDGSHGGVENVGGEEEGVEGRTVEGDLDGVRLGMCRALVPRVPAARGLWPSASFRTDGSARTVLRRAGPAARVSCYANVLQRERPAARVSRCEPCCEPPWIAACPPCGVPLQVVAAAHPLCAACSRCNPARPSARRRPVWYGAARTVRPAKVKPVHRPIWPRRFRRPSTLPATSRWSPPGRPCFASSGTAPGRVRRRGPDAPSIGLERQIVSHRPALPCHSS